MAEPPAEGMEASVCESLDGFTHLTAEKCMSQSTNSLFSKSQYAQVVFHDLCDVYPTDCDIKCRYTLMDNVRPQPGDKIALFKVGWLSVSEYIAFERAQLPDASKSSKLQVTFAAETLPKDDVDLYQLCYVTSGNVIAGASIPFGFRKPHETELIAVEDPADPDLVVFMSNLTQLQETLNKVSEEKDSLLSKCSDLETTSMEMKERLEKASLEKDSLVNEVENLKKDLEKMIKENTDLENKIANSSIDITIKTLKDNIIAIDNEKNQIKQILQEKINEIKVHEATIECLKQDREHIDKNLRDNLTKNESLSAEKAILEERLKTMSVKLNTTVLERLEIREELEEMKKTNEDLQARLQRSEMLISNFSEEHSQPDVRRALLMSDEEKSVLEVKLMTLEEVHNKCAKTISELREAEGHSVRLLQTEMDKAAIEAYNLKKKYEEEKKKREELEKQLRGESSGSSSSNTNEESNSNDSQWDPLSGTVKYAWDMIQNINKCPNCKMHVKRLEVEKTKFTQRVNSLLQEKADSRSELVQVRHEKEELSRSMKEKDEENSALKSRINVLEYEFSMSQNRKNDTDTRCRPGTCSAASGYKLGDIKTDLEKFEDNVAVVKKFNTIMMDKSTVEENLERERKQKLCLQKKVEDLLLQDDQMCKKLQEMRDTFDTLRKEKEELETSINGENVVMMQKLLDDADLVKTKLERELEKTLKEKDTLSKNLMAIRRDAVGKVSLDEVQQMRNEIVSLKEKLQRKTCCADTCERLQIAGVEYARLFEALKKCNPQAAEEIDKLKVDSRMYSAENMTICPFCHIKFSPGSYDEFVKHFDDHMT